LVEAEWVKCRAFYGLNLVETKRVKKVLQRSIKWGQKYLREGKMNIGFRL